MTRSRDWRQQDPNAAAEARRYSNPIPSRAYLLQVLDEQGVPMRLREITSAIGIEDDDEVAALENRLQAMVRDGQLIRNRRRQFCLVDRIPVITGRVVGHRDGYGFVVRDDGAGDDVYLSHRQMRAVFHGDRVAIRVKGTDRRGRQEGALVEVLDRRTTELVGRYLREGGVGFVVPDDSRISHQVIVPRRGVNGARPGQIVIAAIDEPPTAHSQPVGRVMEVLGRDTTPGIETEMAIRTHGLPHRWPEEVQSESAAFGTRVPATAKRDREDLRQVPLVTIDGADARDFDDAVHAERVRGGWRLLVAIADVSHYVLPGTALDAEAHERGTSVYFPTRVIPMLPEVLSNGLCSLNPRVDRLCMVCEMRVDEQGRVTRSRFFEGLMRSAARLTYSEVAAALWGEDAAARRRLRKVLPQLEVLDEVYRAFAGARRRRGAIEFELPEVRFSFNDDGRIEGVTPYARNDAHRIIEECMIAANVQAAKFLRRHRLPTLYRRHDPPEVDQTERLRDFLRTVGLKLGGTRKLEPRDYTRLLRDVSGRAEAGMITTVMLRSMAQAVYHPESTGHFGLALEAYAHFTSPIRRYPDLLVHRGIRHVLRGGKVRDFAYARGDMESLGRHCSSTERRADEATRDAADWLKCEFMQDKIGNDFMGTVSAVTDFGLFVQLDGVGVEGLVHVSTLGHDYFRHEPAHHRLVGDHSGASIRLGDRLRGKVVRADLDERKIDFEPTEPLGGAGGQRRAERGRRRRRGQGASEMPRNR